VQEIAHVTDRVAAECCLWAHLAHWHSPDVDC
jgi:hypothetical protein